VLPRRVASGERLLRTERPTGESGPAVVTFSDDAMFDAAEKMAGGRSQSQ
jgi:hypothetical protein